MIGTCLGGLTVHKPNTLNDAFAILSEHGSDAAILAGGTDLLVDLRVQRRDEHHLVSLAEIDAVRGITKTETGVCIGAATTLNDLLQSDLIQTNYPAMIEAAEVMGSNQIRNTGTIGGNIASAVPSADLPPVLLVLGAEVVIAGQNGERAVPICEFFQGVRKTCVAIGEIVKSISLPTPIGSAVYERFDLRQGNSLAVAAVAANITMDGGTITDAKVALGAVAPIPEIVEGVNDILTGNSCNDTLLHEVAGIAIEASNPITDLRGSAEYRRELVGILTIRAIKRAVEAAQ
ncbi:MAG: xanthine dehydrogenase family protein subunit M [Phycisphaerales bacterium]|jgi:carbon-monoxide dehydrogenase medium subunit|nr:xanthine dehydrogenase family protein subunit M [Phycisphaerales bacterium]